MKNPKLIILFFLGLPEIW